MSLSELMLHTKALVYCEGFWVGSGLLYEAASGPTGV